LGGSNAGLPCGTPKERRIAIVLYGFPPGYGATGTAALNVPRSLLKFFRH